MAIITKVTPKPLAKILGSIYFFFGAFVGLFILIGSLFSLGAPDAGSSLMAGIAAFILIPVAYGLMGFVGGYITAWVYNIFAKKIGGIEVEVQ